MTSRIVAHPAATAAARAASTAERYVSTNLWAYRHWMRSCRGVTLADRDALRQWAAREPAAFRASIHAFARLPAEPIRLVRHPGHREALVCRTRAGRTAWTRDDLLRGAPTGLPPALDAVLQTTHPPAALFEPVAMLLLDADLRPDDRVLVASCEAWPWLCALLEGATLIFDDTASTGVLDAAAEERATVLVLPQPLLTRGIGIGQAMRLLPVEMRWR